MILDFLAEFFGSLTNAFILMGIFYLVMRIFMKNKKMKAMKISFILYIFISLLSYYIALISPLLYILSGALIFLVFYLYQKNKKS
jgi:chromate transport protein ChrA